MTEEERADAEAMANTTEAIRNFALYALPVSGAVTIVLNIATQTNVVAIITAWYLTIHVLGLIWLQRILRSERRQLREVAEREET